MSTANNSAALVRFFLDFADDPLASLAIAVVIVFAIVALCILVPSAP